MTKKIVSFMFSFMLFIMVCCISGCSKSQDLSKSGGYKIELSSTSKIYYMASSTSPEGTFDIYKTDDYYFEGKLYTITYNISDCECFEEKFEIYFYDKNNKSKMKTISNGKSTSDSSYTISYKHDKIKFTVANFIVEYGEKYYDETRGLYLQPWYTKFTDNIVVVIKCNECKKIDATLEI